MINDDSKGTGRTTRALLKAPRGCLYICPTTASVKVIRSMAEKLGRYDIRFIADTSLRKDRLLGCKRSLIVLDHAVIIPTDISEILLSLCD